MLAASMSNDGSSPLPPTYTAWMTQLLDGPIPTEPRATCHDCAMCRPDAGLVRFDPQVKCCTYMPALPNFLVGQALADEDPGGKTGRESLRARIASKLGVTPLGLGRTPSYALVYRNSAGFGRSMGLRCPHYVDDGGLCGIWQHRNAVCATWFCKHVRGQTGSLFWQAVRELLSVVENELAVWCLLQVGVKASALERAMATRTESTALTATDVDGRSDAATYAATWGPWAGREEELYEACAKLVAGIDFAEVLRRCGPEAGFRVEVLRAAWQRLTSRRPPANLRPGQLTVVGFGPAACRVVTYSPNDPFEMHRVLFAALQQFDGRPTQAAVEAIERDEKVTLGEDLLMQMVDFGVLVASPSGEGA